MNTQVSHEISKIKKKILKKTYRTRSVEELDNDKLVWVYDWDLAEILEQHQLWVQSKGFQGKQADLHNADLRCVDLSWN